MRTHPVCDNKKSKQQQPKVNINDLAKHLMPLPVHDRVYPDCPHVTAILIVVAYVDDNLVFTTGNCRTLRNSSQLTATSVFASTTKGLPTGTLAHNSTATAGALHQQAPRTLAHVRLQSYQNTLLRQAGRGPQTSPTAAYNSRSRPAARLQGTHRQPTFPADRHSP